MRTMRPTTVLATLTSILLLAGCSPQAMSIGTPAGEPDPVGEPGDIGEALPGSVCPSCRPQAGGQTSDFSGVMSQCEWVESAPDSAVAARFELDAIAQQLSASVELPLSWGDARLDGERPPASAASSETTVALAFELGPFRHFASSRCTEAVRADVTVTFATEDGEVSGVMHGELARFADSRTWRMFAQTDLAGVAGTLDPALDMTRIHEGIASVVITGSELGMRGAIRVRVSYYPDLNAYERRNDQTDTPSARDDVDVAYAWFPEDGCSDHEFSVPSDEPSGWLAQRSPAQVIDEARALVAAEGAFDAQWSDGSQTSVSIELAAPGERTCIGSGEGIVTLSLQGDARIRSADGHVDVAAPTVRIRTGGSTASAQSIISFARLEPGTPSELAAFGMRDLDLGGRATAGAMVETWHYFGDSDEPSGGRIDIFDEVTFDHLTWPLAAAP